jgi:ADP-ribose pyrophosphatase YjhB (NUDIX family)
MSTQIQPAGGWKTFAEPYPHVTTSGFAFDENGKFPLLYRGPNVRSARNVWSLPSGLHECGLKLRDQFCQELKEECGLEAYPESVQEICVYENIAPDENDAPGTPQWHWVIHILAAKVRTLDTFINKEPEKHPQTQILHVSNLPDFLNTQPWHDSLRTALLTNYDKIREVAKQLSTFPIPVAT